MKDEEIDRLNVNGYVAQSHFSRVKTSKGGVIILSEESFELKRVAVPNLMCQKLIEEMQFEFCACSFTVNKLKYVIVAIYRSPSSDVNIFLERMNVLIYYFDKKFDRIIIAGDLNIDVLTKDSKYKLFKELLKSHNMTYLVNFPTRVTEFSKTAIDNILVKSIDFDRAQIEGLVTCLSDHDGQVLELNFEGLLTGKNTNTKQEIRKFTPENLKLFSQLLSKETWAEVYFAPVESKYDIFQNTLSYYFNQAFPKVSITINYNKKKWITDELKLQRLNIINLTNQLRENKSQELKKKIRLEQNEYKRKIKNAKSEYFQSEVSNSSNIQKTVWKIINSEVGKNSQKQFKNISLKANDQVISDPGLVTELFNDYFVSIVKDQSVCCTGNETVNIVETVNIDNTVNNNVSDEICFQQKFNLRPLEVIEVEKIVSSLKRKNSSGFDEIPISVVKAVNKDLSQVLCHLINSSFVSGIFPDQLKIAKVVPLHKKDDITNMQNYRPISILSSISKIYERAVYIQLSHFLETRNILDPNQHGFRPGRSVTSAAISFLESVIESVDKGKTTTGIFMDLSKAFDSVKHTTLIDKLQTCGLNDKSLNWFKSYLSNRSQYVELTHMTNYSKIIKVSSNCKSLKFGVPQGSILGPLLFLCYLKGINSALTSNIESKLCLYADDSNLLLSTNSTEQTEMFSFVELESIGQFFKTNNLILNPQKTSFITFKTKQNTKINEPLITYNSQIIEKKTSTTFLGLLLDQYLSWDEHVHKILMKINSGIYALSKMSYYCNLQTLKNIYFAHIHSHISFCISLYGSTKKINMNNILIQQKRAIRIMLKLKDDDSTKNFFKQLKILTVFGQYIYECILIVKNEMLGSDSNPIHHPYNTRNKNDIIQPHRLKFFEKKPTYQGKKFIKSIPVHIKEINNYVKFKTLLKDYIVNLAVYSLEEFLTSSS